MKTTTLFALLFAAVLASAQEAKLTRDISIGSDRTPVRQGVEVNGLFIFPARVFTEAHYGLWVTDGTNQGTTRLIEGVVPAGLPYKLTTIDNYCYFYTIENGSVSSMLWRSDGTSEGTSIFFDFGNADFSFLSAPVSIGNRIAVSTHLSNSGGSKLWISDTARTTLQEVPVPNFTSISERMSLVFQEKLYLIARNGEPTNTSTIWTVSLSDLNFDSVYTFTNLAESNKLSFCGASSEYIYLFLENQEAGRELWISDGTSSGTQPIKYITPPNDAFFLSPTAYPIPQSNQVLLSLNDSLYGLELWVSDGTEAGTQVLADINPEGNSTTYLTHYLHYLNGYVYFLANDPVNKWQLWRTDGTPANTEMFTQIPSSISSATQFSPVHTIVVNDLLYFRIRFTDIGSLILRTDGTHAGTFILVDDYDSPSGFPPFTSLQDSLMIFVNLGPGAGYELWKSDGTIQGTTMIQDIAPGPDSGVSTSDYWIALGKDRILFQANDGIHGIEPWILGFDLPVQTVARDEPAELLIFPNPAHQEVFVPIHQKATIDIWSIAGVLVSTQEALPGEPVDVSSLTSGMYLLRIRQTGETARFIKH